MRRAVVAGGGVGLLLALVAACGGSSADAGWRVLDRAEVNGNDSDAYLKVRISRPSDVELRVEADPNVRVRTRYSLFCGSEVTDDTPAAHKRGPTASTPLRYTIPLPKGEPTTCLLNLLATKSAPADMTVTIQWRPPPTQ